MAIPEHTAAQVPRNTARTRPIGFWLKLVDQLIDEQFGRALAEFSVSRQQWEILNILSPGPSTLAELDHDLGPFLDATGSGSAAEQVAELIDRGWVDVTVEHYELTGAGGIKHAELHRVVAKNRNAATAELNESDYAATLRSLERVARTLGWQS